MDRDALHRTLSHSLVARVAPAEAANKITYHVVSTRYAQKRAHFKAKPAKLTRATTGVINGFGPGDAAAASALVAPYAMALVDHVLDFLLGKSVESLWNRIRARIRRRHPVREEAVLPTLTPETLAQVKARCESLAKEWGLEQEQTDRLILAFVELLLAREEDGAQEPQGSDAEEEV